MFHKEKQHTTSFTKKNIMINAVSWKKKSTFDDFHVEKYQDKLSLTNKISTLQVP